MGCWNGGQGRSPGERNLYLTFGSNKGVVSTLSCDDYWEKE